MLSALCPHPAMHLLPATSLGHPSIHSSSLPNSKLFLCPTPPLSPSTYSPPSLHISPHLLHAASFSLSSIRSSSACCSSWC